MRLIARADRYVFHEISHPGISVSSEHTASSFLSLSLSTLSFRRPFVASRGLLFFLLRRHRYDSFCRPPHRQTAANPRRTLPPLLFLPPPSHPRRAPPPLPVPPLPRPFSGPVGKARETFIFARRKSKAEREVLPADRYCEADVFCDSSVIRERVRERREKPKAPVDARSLVRSLAHSLIRDLHRAIRTMLDS